MKRSVVLVALLAGGVALLWRSYASNSQGGHAGHGKPEIADVSSRASSINRAGGSEPLVARGLSSSSGLGRISISHPTNDAIEGLVDGSTGDAPNTGLIEVETRPPGLPLIAVVATGPGIDPTTLAPSKGAARLGVEIELGVEFEGWTPGFTRLFGVTSDGRVSDVADISADSGARPTAILDFEVSRLVRGVVFDSLSAYLLSDVRAVLSSVEGFQLTATDETPSADLLAQYKDLSRSDASGVLEFRFPPGVAAEVALERGGYATQMLRIDPTEATKTDFGQVALEPVDRLEVRLRGFDPSRYQSYRVGISNGPREHEIDVDGVAFVECSKAIVDARVVVRTPDGAVLTRTLSGAARDHSPLTFDLARPTALCVRWNGGPEWSSHDLWAAVTSTPDSAATTVMTARLIDGEANLDVPFVGAVTVGLLDFAAGSSSSWIAMAEVTLDGQTRLIVELDAAWAEHGVRLLDLGGQPLRSQAVSVDLATVHKGWNGVCVTDETGWLALPGPSGRAFRLSGRLEDGRVFVDLPATASSRGESAIEIVLGSSQVYDIRLVDQGQPCPWELLVIKGSGPWSTVWSEFTLEDGTLGEFQVLGEGRPICRIAGPNLLESRREFELQPGLNVLEVRRTAALEVTVPPGAPFESASVRRQSNGAESSRAIGSGRVVIVGQSNRASAGGGTVRWDALPLGTYEWRVGNGSWTVVSLSRPGAVVTVRPQ